MIPQSKRAIIVGASSGIGAACAKRLAKEGYQVALVARRKEKLQDLSKTLTNGSGAKVFAYPFDVNSFEKTPSFFDEIVTELGGLDLIIYASGVMPEVKADEYSFQKDREMIHTNLLGAMAWFNEAAQFFSRIKKGTIVGISSVAGDRGRKGNPAYCTSKAALNTYLESLRNRLDGHSVHVLTIKPGFVDTDMTRGKPGLFGVITAEEAARQILRAVEKKKNTVYVPRFWRYLMTVIRSIPSMIFRKLNV
jgi:short-subunit dehydrogenase